MKVFNFLDGIVQVSEGNAFVPDGISAWEISTSENKKSKADEDYDKRSKDPLGLDPSSTSFVFVTLRRWEGKEKWAEETIALMLEAADRANRDRPGRSEIVRVLQETGRSVQYDPREGVSQSYRRIDIWEAVNALLGEEEEPPPGRFDGARIVVEWDARADLDFHLTTPGGETVDWRNRSAAGCRLLNDERGGGSGSKKEILCERGSVEMGTYTAGVNYFIPRRDQGAVEVRVTITLLGDQETRRGSSARTGSAITTGTAAGRGGAIPTPGGGSPISSSRRGGSPLPAARSPSTRSLPTMPIESPGILTETAELPVRTPFCCRDIWPVVIL